MQRKQPYLYILLAFVMSASVSLSLSFLVRNITTENVVSFGNIRIQLIETEMLSDGTEQNVDLTECVNVTQITSLDRRIKVKNVGSHPAYVRLKLHFKPVDAEGSDGIQECMSFEFDAEHWILEDGWYYFKDVLMPTDITANLMDTLYFDNNALCTYYAGKSMILDVEAQAVQVKNNGNSVMEAKGWPEEGNK